MSNLHIQYDDYLESPTQKSPKSKKIRKTESHSPKKNAGHWTKEEHEKYLQFLEQNQHLKKNNKIFKPMSEMIGTRSPSQCRSHHQKFNPLSPQQLKKKQPIIQLPPLDPLPIQLIKYEDQEEQYEMTPLEKYFASDFNLDDY